MIRQKTFRKIQKILIYDVCVVFKLSAIYKIHKHTNNSKTKIEIIDIIRNSILSLKPSED